MLFIYNKNFFFKIIIFLVIFSFLNLIFIKGEVNSGLNNGDSDSLIPSTPAIIPSIKTTSDNSQEYDDLNNQISMENSVLSLYIKGENMFKLEIKFKTFIYSLEMRSSNFSNINIKFIDNTESNYNPSSNKILTNIKSIEFQYYNGDKTIFSNQILEEIDPSTSQKKIFYGFLKNIFANGEFIIYDLKCSIFCKENSKTTEISTLKQNTDDSKELFLNKFTKNNDHPLQNQLSDVHPTPFYTNYYFLFGSIVIILIIGGSIFYLGFKKNLN
ncbi:MAG: hypothetical protein ACLTFB_02530 [Candidatus Phytoplasma pyri]